LVSGVAPESVKTVTTASTPGSTVMKFPPKPIAE
jgi:hypothetical protein